VPAYVVTSSLKRSTIQRSSLSMIASRRAQRHWTLVTIRPWDRPRQ
jgi:hypothetical protein